MDGKFKIRLLVASLGVLVFWAGLGGHTAALIGALLALVAVGLAYLWNHYIFSKLTLERRISRRRVEFGNPVTMHLAVTNRKILPVFGLEIEYGISSGLALGDPDRLVLLKNENRNRFQDFFSLNWYEKRERRYELRPERRGRFEFEAGTLNYADPFGFFRNKKVGAFDPLRLIVLPKVVPVKGIAALNTHLFGTRPKEGWIFTDPLNRVGTRQYQSTDSAHRINWKASARHLKTQVDLEKPSRDTRICLVVDQPASLPWWTTESLNRLEIAIITAASLIDCYARHGYDLRLLTNLVSVVHGRALTEVSRGSLQRQHLLTTLALLQGFSSGSTVKMLQKKQAVLRSAGAIILITTALGELDASLAGLLRNLARQTRLAVLRVPGTDRPAANTKGVREWLIEGGAQWDELQALELC